MGGIIASGPNIGRHMENFLATGNLNSRTGLGLKQVRTKTMRKNNLSAFMTYMYIIWYLNNDVKAKSSYFLPHCLHSLCG